MAEGVTFSVPDKPLSPLQAPVPVHQRALRTLQVSVEEAPASMVVGLAVNEITGTVPPFTVTVVDADVLPLPLQVRPYVDVAVGDTLCEPESALLPLHAPVPVHQRALRTLQVSVDEPPDVIVVGLAPKEIVGAACAVEASAASAKVHSHVVANPSRRGFMCCCQLCG